MSRPLTPEERSAVAFLRMWSAKALKDAKESKGVVTGLTGEARARTLADAADAIERLVHDGFTDLSKGTG